MNKDLCVDNLVGFLDVDLKEENLLDKKIEEINEFCKILDIKLRNKLFNQLDIYLVTPLILEIDMSKKNKFNIYFGLYDDISKKERLIYENCCLGKNINKNNMLYVKYDKPELLDWNELEPQFKQIIKNKNITRKNIKNIYFAYLNNVYIKGLEQLEIFLELGDEKI